MKRISAPVSFWPF